MNYSTNQDFALTTAEKKLLLQEFEEILQGISIFSWGLRGFRTQLSASISLKLTVLMQKIGYNFGKVSSLKGQDITLNLGCAGDTNNTYLNGDLFPNIGQMFKILSGKSKVEYDLFIEITSYDKNLLEVADGIVLSHVLEHISPKLAIDALKNCFAYLKIGGGIRISVPSIEKSEQLSSSRSTKIKNMLERNRLIYCHGHQFMYNVDLLTFLMLEVGFSEVKEVHFQQGLLGSSDVPERQAESIYLTGTKA